jgi:type VI secretion system secreted protein Hcp
MKIKFVVVLAALLAWTAPVRAAFDAFLEIDGIQGESTAVGHENSIEISSYSWGMSQTTTTGGTGAGKVSFQDLHFTKRLDKATPKLMLACAGGQHLPTVTFVFRKAGGDDKTIFLKITLQDVLVSSYQTGGSSGDELAMETVSFNFSKVIFEYTPPPVTGGVSTPVRFGWDLATNTRI